MPRLTPGQYLWDPYPNKQRKRPSSDVPILSRWLLCWVHEEGTVKQLGWGITTWGWARHRACASVRPAEVTSLIPSGDGQPRQKRLCRAPRPSSSPQIKPQASTGNPTVLEFHMSQSALRQHAPCSRFCPASLPPTRSSHPWFPAPPASTVSVWQHSTLYVSVPTLPLP